MSKNTMRRMSCLLLFTLVSSMAVAAGYDSRDTKQALTYQVDSDDNGYSMEVLAVDAELPVELIVAAPYPGLRKPIRAILTAKASEGFDHVATCRSEGIYGDLITQDSFGCIQFEPKEMPDKLSVISAGAALIALGKTLQEKGKKLLEDGNKDNP